MRLAPAFGKSITQLMAINYRLGLDLGTNSLGWTMLELDSDRRPFRVFRMGVRIFSDGREPDGNSLAATRTEKRGQRIRRERFLKRRSALLSKLKALGLFPSDRVIGRNLATLDPYEQRAKALAGKLHPFHLGRALIHLAQRRGFKSNRKSAKTDEAKVIGPAVAALAGQLETRTLGQLLYERLQEGKSTRFRPDSKQSYELYPTRAMYEHEFDAIRTAQAPHQSLAPDDWAALRKIIFDQLPLKAQERGRCRFLSDAKGIRLPRAPLALPSFQQFRILSDANHLAYREDLGSRLQTLTSEQRVTVFELLRTQKSCSFGRLRTALDLPDSARFNLESDKRDGLVGDPVAYLLAQRKYFGRAWHDLPLDRRDAIVTDLLDDTIPDEVLLHRAMQDWGLAPEVATSLAGLSPNDFPRSTAPFSGEFCRRLVPPMLTGLGYAAAVEAIGFKHSLANADGSDDKLPYYGKAMPESCMLAPKSRVTEEREFGRIANPTVHIALNQLRRVVNTLIDRYGKPAEITLELARNLKLTAKQRAELEKEQAGNKKQNDVIRRELSNMEPPVEDNYDNRLRFKLWQELSADANDRFCPYSHPPRRIALSILFSDELEIDHILPFGATLDDSPANKILAFRATNRTKGKRSPHEAFGTDPDRYAEILDRASSLRGNKRWRFQPDAMDKFCDTQGFLARQLKDTQYLAKISQRYLTTICPPGDVKVFPGRLTALLRHHWGLDTLLAQPDADRIAKNRADHRHHAIDALVVALADVRMLRQIQSANEADRLGDIEVPPPWPALRAEAESAVAAIVVSHRQDHNPAGRLHEETAYGQVRKERRRPHQNWEHEQGYGLVVRKPLSNLKSGDLETIRDHTLRTKLGAHLDGITSDDKTTWATKLASFTAKTGVRSVRLLKKDVTARPFFKGEGRHEKLLIPGDVHSVTFGVLPEGRIDANHVTLLDANNPKFVPSRHPAARKLFTVHKGDALRTLHKGELKTVVVCGLRPSEGNRYVVCLPHTAADKKTTFTIQFTRVLLTQTRLIHVNTIGDVQDSGPRQ
jgi:CRISPR-associated endonuclease Csn1